jgi:hypothetical protein
LTLTILFHIHCSRYRLVNRWYTLITFVNCRECALPNCGTKLPLFPFRQTDELVWRTGETIILTIQTVDNWSKFFCYHSILHKS